MTKEEALEKIEELKEFIESEEEAATWTEEDILENYLANGNQIVYIGCRGYARMDEDNYVWYDAETLKYGASTTEQHRLMVEWLNNGGYKKERRV